MDTVLQCALIIWAMVVWGLWFSRLRTNWFLGANFIAVYIAAIVSVAVIAASGMMHVRLSPLQWITGLVFIIAASAMTIEIKAGSQPPR